jgi:hypothetical protein
MICLVDNRWGRSHPNESGLGSGMDRMDVENCIFFIG